MNKKSIISASVLRYFVALILIGTLVSAKETGCHRVNADLSGKDATKVRSVNYLLKKLKGGDLGNIQNLNARAKIHVDGDGQSMSVSANIIWIRDSVLWLNVKKFGIEAARALITRDSVFILNRLNRTWSSRGLESLESTYSLPDGFAFLQQFIVAAAWLDPNMEMKADIKDKRHRLSGSNNNFAADYRLEEGSFLLRSQTFMQPKDARNVSLSFENYRKTQSTGQFPYLRKIEAFSPETGNLRLEIELSDVQINIPKNYKFEIPGSYDKED